MTQPAGNRPSNRTVIVAGATARTGPTVVRMFLEAGFAVTATARDGERLRALAATLLSGGDGGNGRDAHGGMLHTVVADLLHPAQVEGVVAATVARFGRVDAATTLASAGFLQKPFAETTLDDLRRLIEGNVYTTYTLCRAVLPRMLAQGGGHIVTVAGGSALDPAYGRPLFGASKAAIVTMTKGIARDHKAQGIVANCLVAGTIATDEARQYLDEDDLRAAATMQEFANALVFLCSAQSSGINGAAVDLNAREVD